MKPVAITESIYACRHPKDDIFGACCQRQSRVMITGDKDLLALHPFRGIAISQPAEYLRHVAE